MNRTKLLPLVLVSVTLVLGACVPGNGLGGGVPGSKVIKTETRHTGAFEAIILEIPADVTLQQGAEDSVRIEADDNLLRQISTEVTLGRLTITSAESEWKARVNPSQPVKIAITMKDPRDIVFAAPVGTLQVNDLTVGTLKLALTGAGEVSVAGLQAEVLEVVLSGAGDIQVAGAAKELKLVLSGWGNFNAGNLACNDATIELTGAGEATVHAENELLATIKGAGSVKYFGNPRIEQTVSGSGSVKPAGQSD